MIKETFINLFLVLSNGFYFCLYILFKSLYSVFHYELFSNLCVFFHNKQNDYVSFIFIFLIMLCLLLLFSYTYVDYKDLKYVNNNILYDEVYSDREVKDYLSDKDESNNMVDLQTKEINLYRKYGSINIDEFHFSSLNNISSDIVSWLLVDGTNINYPIVQSSNNDYYLNHDIKGNFSINGWTYMDYRNNVAMNDRNTIFYGHNLINKTAFGSLINIFSDEWYHNSNHFIVVYTDNKKYVYEVFSSYIISPETYYLKINFNSNLEYMRFLKVLQNRSLYDYHVDLTSSSRIITLSTCTDDNLNRRVVHAKLIEK